MNNSPMFAYGGRIIFGVLGLIFAVTVALMMLAARLPGVFGVPGPTGVYIFVCASCAAMCLFCHIKWRREHVPRLPIFRWRDLANALVAVCAICLVGTIASDLIAINRSDPVVRGDYLALRLWFTKIMTLTGVPLFLIVVAHVWRQMRRRESSA